MREKKINNKNNDRYIVNRRLESPLCVCVCLLVCSVKAGFIKFCSEFLALKYESGCTVHSSRFCFFVNLDVSIGPLDHQIW